MSYGFNYQFGSNGFDASGGYSEAASTGAYGGYVPGQYDTYGEEAEKIELKSDPNHGKQLRKLQGQSDLKMFVGGLSQYTTTGALMEYFAQFGKVQDVDIKTDPHTGASRGFGFILFEEAESVERVTVGGPHNLDGKRIDPKTASKNSKIFVGGLKPETTDEVIKAYFTEQFGVVDSYERNFDAKTNQGKPFAFVTMKDDKLAAAICKNRWHKIDDKQVECKTAVDNYQYKAQQTYQRPGYNNYAYNNAYAAPSFGSSYGQFGGGGKETSKTQNRTNPY